MGAQGKSIEPFRYTIHVLLLLVGHYGFVLLFPIDAKDTWSPYASTCVFTGALWAVVLWSSAFAYQWMDLKREAGVKFRFEKLSAPPSFKKEPPFSRMVLVCLRNSAVIFFVMRVIGVHVNGVRPFYRSDQESLLRTILWTVVHFAIADIFFYSGHLLMHRSRWLFRYTHATHHSSCALRALSGYYMDTIDYVLEHLPVIVSFMLFPECGPAWVVAIAVGTWNLMATHSGWDLPFGPDPREHFIHHVRHHCNYGIFLDRPMGTYVAPDSFLRRGTADGEK